MAERDARKALTRLRRSVEKAARELSAVESALAGEPDAALPSSAFAGATDDLRGLEDFIEEQSARLQEHLLRGAGLSSEQLKSGAGKRDQR